MNEADDAQPELPGRERRRLQTSRLVQYLLLQALIGLAVTFLLVAITEYYTGTRWKPVKDIASASQTGHATNIISGLAVGMQATAFPVIVIAVLCHPERRSSSPAHRHTLHPRVVLL